MYFYLTNFKSIYQNEFKLKILNYKISEREEANHINIQYLGAICINKNIYCKKQTKNIEKLDLNWYNKERMVRWTKPKSTT